MQRVTEYLWLVIVIALFVYFAFMYNQLPNRTRIVLGIAMFISALLYSFRRGQNRKR